MKKCSIQAIWNVLFSTCGSNPLPGVASQGARQQSFVQEASQMPDLGTRQNYGPLKDLAVVPSSPIDI